MLAVPASFSCECSTVPLPSVCGRTILVSQKSGTREVCDQECATCWKERRGIGTTGPCVEGSRCASGAARHQDIVTPIGHLEHVRRFVVTLSDEHQTLLSQILLVGDVQAALLLPASLCGGEGDMFVAVCRPRGSGRVRQEARPGHVGVLEVHSARQPCGLGRRSEGHRPVANVFGRFGCPWCPRQRGALGRTACPRSWSVTQMSLASLWDSRSTRQRRVCRQSPKLPGTLPNRSTLSLGAPETGGNMKRLFALRRRSERRVCSQDG